MALLKMLLPFPNRDLTALTDVRDLLLELIIKKLREKEVKVRKGEERVCDV